MRVYLASLALCVLLLLVLWHTFMRRPWGDYVFGAALMLLLLLFLFFGRL